MALQFNRGSIFDGTALPCHQKLIPYFIAIADPTQLSQCLNCSNSHYKNRFFESPLLVGFQKNDFGVSSALGTGNTKIVFIMRIADA